MAQDSHDADFVREQIVLDSWSRWIDKELPDRRSAADRAYKRALQAGDEAAWQHAEIMERSYGQLLEMKDRQDPYFSRIRGKMKDVDGEPFEVDLRVHRYHRSEVFPVPGGQEMLDISHLAPVADLVRNPAQQELQLTMKDRDFLQWEGKNPHILVMECAVEDVELENGRVVRVAPRYGAIFEDRVRRRLGQSAMPALDVLADVLDKDQNAIVGDRSPNLKLIILDGPAGTGKTVVAAHRIAVAARPDSPGLYLTPTTTLRDYVRPVLPRLGLERTRAQALSLADLAGTMWPDFPWVDQMAGLVPDSDWDQDAWTDALNAAQSAHPNMGLEGLYRRASETLGRKPPTRVGLEDVAALLWLGAWSKRPRPQPEPEWIIIDEAQAIPLLAYRALRAWLGPSVSWVIAGDLMQQGSQHDWDGWTLIQQALEMKGNRMAKLWLSRSYRVPPKIHAAAERLRLAVNPKAQPSESVTWHPHVGQVMISSVADQDEMETRAGESVREWAQAGIVSVALLVPNSGRMADWEARLKSWQMPFQALHGDRPYAGGLALTTLDVVRGLEFDGVILLECSESAYPNDAASARTLYTSLTRARRAAHLLAIDQPHDRPSPWLSVVQE